MTASDDSLSTLSFICGIIYFLAWTISFIPQCYLNWRRKSVVGLSFDFQLLNLTGYCAYTAHNLLFYFNGTVQHQYFVTQRDSKGVVPVDLSDVGFSVFALLITCFTIAQCFVYDTGGQVPSLASVILAAALWLAIDIAAALSGVGAATWLDFTSVCAYVKLIVTATKYVPQAVLNYRRKSTVGWSIANILLDLTGGTFSFIQQGLDSAIAGNFAPFVGNPVKLGLSFLSIGFDLIFIVQHYVLYRDRRDPARENVATSGAHGSSVHTVADDKQSLIGSNDVDDERNSMRSIGTTTDTTPNVALE
jgi:cystinosin